MTTTKDPVCKMDVHPTEAKIKSDYKGDTYHFCSAGCKEQFEKTPEKYACKKEAGCK